MGGQSINTSETRAEALQLQSSAKGVTIAWVRGVHRLAGNLAWYDGFTAIENTETQGGKGGADVSTTTYTYTADMVIGVAHGPITDVPRIWRGKRLFSGGVTGSQIDNLSDTWTVPLSGAMTRGLPGSGAFLGVSQVAQDIGGGLWRTLSLGVDYSVSASGVLTILSEALRGESIRTQYQRANATINRAALAELGMSFSAGWLGQAAPSVLSAYPAASIGYSGLCILSADDYDLGRAASVENHNLEVVAPLAFSISSSIPDADPALVLAELMLDDRAGASLPAAYLGDWSAWSDYCVAAGLLVSLRLTTQRTAADVLQTAADLTNAYVVTTDGTIRMVPYADSAETGNGRTYTPNTTPVYDLDDECYTPAGDGSSPVRYRHRGNADRYNHWRLDFSDRANDYNRDVAEAKDTADIEARGLRTSPETVDATDWICRGVTARKAVQLRMQRSISVLTEYDVPLPWHYSLIDLGDPLTLTDSRLGMDRETVRVTAIEESEDGDLRFTCEDYPIGSASAPTYAAPEGGGYRPDFNADPGSVDAPLIFEGPASLANPTGVELWIAVRGASPNWGGAQVWLSLSGSNYKRIGVVSARARYGALSASLTSGATSMQVDGLQDAQLLSGTAAEAEQLATLCYLGGTNPEFVAYETATLTGAGAYTLAGLVRGAYDSGAAAHADNDAFVRLDESIARTGPLEPTIVGKTVRIKCTSYNIVGARQQSLADATEYTYTVTGTPAANTPGVGGKAVTIAASATVINLDAGGTPTPSSVTLTAKRSGGLRGTVTWSVVSGTATLTGSGDTRTLTNANMGSDTVRVRASVTDGVGTYTDEETIVRQRAVAVGLISPVDIYNQVSRVSPDDALVGARFNRDGTISVRNTAGAWVTSARRWYEGGGATIGDSHWIYFERTSGDTATGSALKTWLQLSTARSIEHAVTSNAGGIAESAHNVFIARDSAGGEIGSSGVIKLFAEVAL